MVDASDSKSDTRKGVWVQVSPSVFLNNFMKNTFFAFFLISICACSQTIKSESPFPNSEIKNINIFLSRSSLGITEFEQFKLTGNSNLFYECGKINRGRYVPEVQEIKNIETASANEILSLTNDLLQAKEKTKSALEKPGNNGSLFDPGQLMMEINSKDSKSEIKTSLDSISDAQTDLQIKIRALTRKFRSSTMSKLCGNKEFYGI